METANRQNGKSRFVYELSPTESVSEAVITAISTASGTDPAPGWSTETDASLDPLYTVVDPDALDALFQPTAESDRANGRITFRYHGYGVTVHGDGRIFLERLDAPTDDVAD